MNMENIINFRVIDDRIASGGQPNLEQIESLARSGYQVFINLALPTSTDAIPNEGELVTCLGMTYIHIPVVWDAPKPDDFHQFMGCMRAFQEKKVFVHCARNMRASSFLFLYRVIVQRMNPDIALDDVRIIWQPNETWQRYMAQMLTHYKTADKKEENHD
jgi:protein tyrosine phosphatase (PTP) superfamily phosphohydrolase (DUF442 family)